MEGSDVSPSTSLSLLHCRAKRRSTLQSKMGLNDVKIASCGRAVFPQELQLLGIISCLTCGKRLAKLAIWKLGNPFLVNA